MFPTRQVSAALLVILSLSACEFFESKPFAPQGDNPSLAEVPNVLAKYAPDLPPNQFARASALGPSLFTGSVVGDAMNGLRLSAQPVWPSAVNLAAVTPAVWVSELGTGLQYTDDETTQHALPFSFSFYGQAFASVFVSANGHISFGAGIPFKRSWNIPDGANVFAAPVYMDWMPASRFGYASLQNSRVFVNTVGPVGDRRFVVTWNDMRPCCSLSTPGSSFQLQLLERTGEIVFAYREMQMVGANASAGLSADLQRFIKSAGGAAVLALQGCTLTYTPNAGSYREANSCAPEPVNVPPAVQVGGPYASNEGSELTLGGSATDENGDALTYSWDLGDGTTAGGANVAHSYVDNGVYPATLSVSDGELVTVATTRVDVANVAPSLSALEGASLFVGDAFPVSLEFSDVGANDAPWRWTIAWGDGASQSGEGTSTGVVASSHTFMAPGVYTVRVTVSDKDNDLASVEAAVEVKKDEIAIDIKPWDANNRVYLKGKWDKQIPVAIFSNERLDARTIDVSTVKLESVGVTLKNGDDDDDSDSEDRQAEPQYLATLYDIDKDGDMDLLVLFDRKKLVKAGHLTTTTSSLTLTGVAGVERKIAGSNPVQVVK